MEVVCLYLSQVIEKMHIQENWLIEMNELIKLNSGGVFSNCMHLDLDVFLNSEDRIELFIEIIHKTKALFKSKGDRISVDELNSYIIDDYLQAKWIEPAELQMFIDILDLFEALIRGRLETISYKLIK